MGTSLPPEKADLLTEPRTLQHLGHDVVLPVGCPLRLPTMDDDFRKLLRQSGAFSLRIAEHVGARGEDAATAWLHQAAAHARPLLRPWVMEILFVLGAHQEMRFGELEQGLGISSKVLATRLRELTQQGQVERIVIPDTPVRISYRLTKLGKGTASLATPLFTHLNLIQGIPQPDVGGNASA